MFDESPYKEYFSAESIIELMRLVQIVISEGNYNVGEVMSALARVTFSQLQNFPKEDVFKLLERTYEDYQLECKAMKAGMN